MCACECVCLHLQTVRSECRVLGHAIADGAQTFRKWTPTARMCVSSHNNLVAPTAYSHGPELQPRGHPAHNVGAIKRCPLISYFPKRSAVNAKAVAAMAGSCPSSLFICGLPISCQTHTHLVVLTGQVNTHTGSMRGNATAGHTVSDL